MKKISILFICSLSVFLLMGCSNQPNTDTDSFSEWANKRLSEIDSQYSSEMKAIDSQYAWAFDDSSSTINKPTTEQNMSSETEYKQPELIIDKNGKKVYKIYIVKNQIHFSGKYTGNGNFIIKLSNSNQDLVAVVTNEIKDCIVDKTITLHDSGIYYLEIDYSEGKYDLNWE